MNLEQKITLTDDFFDTDLLRSVSRSFYLSLRILPSAVRRSLSLAYLLARASDTLADDNSVSIEERAQRLEKFRTCLGSATVDWEEKNILGTGLSAGEKNLLQHIPSLLKRWQKWPEPDRTLIRQVLALILTGQQEDLVKTELKHDEELDRYTYLVAGSVGEFWTDLCTEHLPSYAKISRDELRQLGRSFGQGLQLINILRDIPKDAALGRRYVPTSDTAFAKTATLCETRLRDGLRYAASIRGLRCRFAVFLPALLGLKTLALWRENQPESLLRPVKVNRRMVQQTICSALWKSCWA